MHPRKKDRWTKLKSGIGDASAHIDCFDRKYGLVIWIKIVVSLSSHLRRDGVVGAGNGRRASEKGKIGCNALSDRFGWIEPSPRHRIEGAEKTAGWRRRYRTG